jgi:hypothetical protein
MTRPADYEDTIYGGDDQPVCCPKCQTRANIEGPRPSKWNSPVFDAKCLNPACGFEFLADAEEPEGDDDEEVEEPDGHDTFTTQGSIDHMPDDATFDPELEA